MYFLNNFLLYDRMFTAFGLYVYFEISMGASCAPSSWPGLVYLGLAKSLVVRAMDDGLSVLITD